MFDELIKVEYSSLPKASTSVNGVYSEIRDESCCYVGVQMFALVVEPCSTGTFKGHCKAHKRDTAAGQ